MTAPASPYSLANICDLLYPPTGTIGHLILLSGDLISFQPTIANSVFHKPLHGLAAGSRVRVASTGNLPAPLAANTDYFVLYYSDDDFRLLTSLDSDGYNPPIDITSPGDGVLTVYEQKLTFDNYADVLIRKELPEANGYSRLPIGDVGIASVVAGNGAKTVTLTMTNTGTANIDFAHVLIAFGSDSQHGSTAGITTYFLKSEAATQSISPGQTRDFPINLRVKPA